MSNGHTLWFLSEDGHRGSDVRRREPPDKTARVDQGLCLLGLLWAYEAVTGREGVTVCPTFSTPFS